jgi:hypothetical protein
VAFPFSFSSSTEQAMETWSLPAPGGTGFISCSPRLLFSAAQSDNDGWNGLPGNRFTYCICFFNDQ